MGDSDDAAAVVRAIDEIGIDRLTETIVAAWEGLGGVEPGPSWPQDEARHRFELSAPDEAVGLDLFSAVLDASPRTPTEAFVHLGLGRRDNPGIERFAVETIADHTEVSATDTHTTGTVPITAETFDALARVHGETLVYAVVCDDDGRAILERDWTTLRFSLPPSAAETVRETVGPADAERFEQV
ncbi:hypothetical protein Har1130_13130 [Haloarcula sp. CBA1130]|uniref:hypothetical protein n=1 Tax=unclassified Haloarcula TaxID=2624677 RepID=UPI00124594DE|nr:MULTISPECIES: hypothetical protein [unclassified Haloarcula]KAA9399142.1 hypothetical protein Har1129_13230 [Haloarcula sp. CBA1129]KAA9403655.1 hypothetical protein Har1130_13130 [Haloarcula sp. CBA1130]